MDPLTGLALSAGSSLIGGLFGRRHGANPWEKPFNDSLSDLAATRGSYADLARSAGAEYNGWNSALGNATRQRVADLGRDPYSDPYSAAQLNRATAGTAEAYNAARAGLAADMAARGITSSGSQAGALAAIHAARANTFANAQNGLAQQKIAQHNANADQILQLLGGARANALQSQLTGLGGASGIDQYRNGVYGNLMGAENARRQQQSSSLMNLFGQIGRGVGSYLGSRGADTAGEGAGEGVGAGMDANDAIAWYNAQHRQPLGPAF